MNMVMRMVNCLVIKAFLCVKVDANHPPLPTSKATSNKKHHCDDDDDDDDESDDDKRRRGGHQQQ
jgi:hypothetical protein